MTSGSPFTDPLAVETWDSRFRCRENGMLRDVTIESTWERIGNAAAAVETRKADVWADRFAQLFLDWRLLPGEDILRSAGTTAAAGWALAPSAALNIAAFVHAPFTPRAWFDADHCTAVAELAVRFLDNVLLLGGETRRVPFIPLRIGLIGFSDAMCMLGLPYDSDAARSTGVAIAKSIATGATVGACQLAAERGAARAATGMLLRRCENRGMSADILSDVRRHGMRHVHLTAVESHQPLALLANNVADALDPLSGTDQPHAIETPAGTRIIRSSGAALSLAKQRMPAMDLALADTIASVPADAQLRLRAAVQPWVDASIDYPVTHFSPPTMRLDEKAVAMASKLGLPRPSWRSIDAAAPTLRTAAS